MTAADHLKQALVLSQVAPDFSAFCGPASQVDIELAERMLGCRLPDDDRMFLATLGAGNLGSQVLYGVMPGKVPGSSVPSVLWLPLDERETAGAPWGGSPLTEVCDIRRSKALFPRKMACVMARRDLRV